MSGHSKWSTIKRQKGAADIKRGLTFTKVANAITIATKMGGSGDPESNPRLRMAMEEAREVNMPKDNINRAIDRGLGKLPGQSIEEISYEGFGPGKVAFFIEGLTDNKLRTNQEIRNIFEKSNGILGGQGSTAYMFDKKGEIRVISKGGNMDDEILELIDLGAEDVEDYTVYTKPTLVGEVSNRITQAGFVVESTEIVYKPNITVQVTDSEVAKKVMEFIGKLEDHPDIQGVYDNFRN